MKKDQGSIDPPKCASCGERVADGTLFINYEPYERAKRRGDDDPPRMRRGWSLHLPMCGECPLGALAHVELDADLRAGSNTRGHVATEGTGG